MNVFNYWEGEMPSVIRLCKKTFEKNSEIQYIMLDEKTIHDFVQIDKIDNKIMNKLPDITQKVDYLRLLLLYQNGGIWFDADCIVYKSLNPIIDNINKHGFVGWTNMRGAKHKLANNFLGCHKGSEIMNELIDYTRNFVLNKDKVGKYELITQCLWSVMENKDYYRYFREEIGTFPVGNAAYDYAIDKNTNPSELLKHDPITTMLFNKIYDGLESKTENEILHGDMLISKLFRHSLEID